MIPTDFSGPEFRRRRAPVTYTPWLIRPKPKHRARTSVQWLTCELHSTHPRARGPCTHPRARGRAYLVRIPRLRVPGGLIGADHLKLEDRFAIAAFAHLGHCHRLLCLHTINLMNDQGITPLRIPHRTDEIAEIILCWCPYSKRLCRVVLLMNLMRASKGSDGIVVFSCSGLSTVNNPNRAKDLPHVFALFYRIVNSRILSSNPTCALVKINFRQQYYSHWKYNALTLDTGEPPSPL